MGFLCDFCGEQRAMVYCRSDAACLCLSCDRNVHSANALSKRHSRTLLCERCNSQSAFVRCSEEKISLCQNCDWTGHENSTPASMHKRQTINCYSGCPSAAELSSIWSFVLDFPSVSESACEQEMGLMSIADMSQNDACEMDKKGVDAGTSSVSGFNNSPMQNLEEAPGSTNNASAPKLYRPGTKGPAFCEKDSLYDDFDMDEMDLSLENYDELFGMTLTHSEELFENGGIDSLFKAKGMSAADSNCQGAVAAEGSSALLLNAMQPECSNAASADSMMSAKTEPILCFTGRQANPSLSFSNVTGDSNPGDFQECDTSILLMGEPPWCPPTPSTEASITSASRSKAVMRYKEKKKSRKFDKTVRYASRKARADVRKRVKGRFVKAGEVYDYDPLSPTRSY